MNNEWMIDVLTDLRKFAEKQSMLDLAEHLDDAILVAASELSALEKSQAVVKPHEYDVKVSTFSEIHGDHRVI